MSKFQITANHSPDGEFCRIHSVDADGNEGAIIVESKDLVSVIALLAQLATNIQKKKGSQNVPYFPAHGFEIHKDDENDRVLMTFRVDPDLAMTFGMDERFLRDVLTEIQPFLEDGPRQSKPKRGKKN